MGVLEKLFTRKNDLEDFLVQIKKTKILKHDLFSNDYLHGEDTSKTLKILSKYGFSKKTLNLTKNLGLEIKKDLSISGIEYLFLCPFLLKNKSVVSVDGIIKFVSGNDKLVVHVYKHLFALYRKGILQILPADGDVHFCNSINFQAYLSGDKWAAEEKPQSLKQIIRTIDSIANLYNNFIPIAAIGENEILEILNKNSHYEYCQELLNLFLQSKEETDFYQFVFYILGHMILNKSKIDKDSDLIDTFCRFDKNREYIVDDIYLHDEHPVYKMKIFDRSIDESGKADQNSIEIHADFKRKYLQGIIKERKHESVILNDRIVKKNLYFNSENQKQIDDLTEMLKKEQFDLIKERLKNSGTRSGFACLFSGEPGSGKTEEALQIAKATGRDIIKVDMSTLRSKWWGEDEKNVKAIFNNYKSILQDSRIEPILLLNEADAIIGKRLDITGNNGAIINSINATQNIILEELENFEGILIATTNLTQNMDNAFERRFLYKIEFEKPSVENRAKIWIEFLKINEKDAEILANKFPFTGAQIENIFRKKMANTILYGDEYSLDKLIELCGEEKLEKEKKIGFFN
jgi:SpoVK/Ycf46/Vps4 family AAA+-type ATPase